MNTRESRNQHALLLRRLITGKITNDEYEDAVYDLVAPMHYEIFSNGSWFLYSDLKTYRLTGKDSLQDSTKREVARWIMFLRSTADYHWPLFPSFLNLKRLVNWLTFGKLYSKELSEFSARFSQGTVEYWPFYSQKQYEESLKNPTLLTENYSA